MPERTDVSSRPKIGWWLPFSAGVVVLGLFGIMAQETRIYSRPDAAEQNYNLLVRGFQSGHLSLKRDVPAGLAELADPLDPKANERFRAPPADLLDLSYYRNKLYLYFGVTPALLLFWPWAALTGSYLSHQAAVAVFCAIAFLAGAGLLGGIWRRFFPESGAALVGAGLLAFGLATGMPVILQRAEFYEVAVSCACALTMLALLGVWLALDRPARGCRWLALASLAYGLAIGARPSVLFGAVILLVPVAVSWRGRIAAGSSRPPWGLLAAAALPLAGCGLLLMLYNFLRFDNPFEFGQHYQMSRDRVVFSPRYFWFNFRVYFLRAACWSRQFPFVHDFRGPPPPPGHAEVESGGGVLANLPVLWLALAAPLAWRQRSGPALRAIVAAMALLFGAAAFVLCLFIGNAWRYEVEFLPALALLSVIGGLGLERAWPEHPALRIAIRAVWALLLAFSLAYSLLESVNGHAEQIHRFALSLVRAGKLPEGIAQYEHALKLRPDFAEAHGNLGDALTRIPGRLPEAIVQLQEAVRLNPTYPEIQNNLGNALLQVPGRLPGAIAHLQEAVRLRPDYAEAHNNLGTALNLDGRTAEAIAQYQVALRLKPGDIEAHNNLANALFQVPGRLPEAIAQYEEALRLAPGSAAIHFNFAVALLRAPGRAGEAAAQLETVLRLQPDNASARQLLAKIRATQP